MVDKEGVGLGMVPYLFEAYCVPGWQFSVGTLPFYLLVTTLPYTMDVRWLGLARRVGLNSLLGEEGLYII